MPGQASKENGKLGGRPKGTKAPHTLEAEQAKAYITERVTKELEPIITVAIEQAKGGDKDARKDLLDRAYGKAKEQIEHSGKVNVVFDE